MISDRDRRTLAIGTLGVSLLLGISRGLPAARRWERRQRDDLVAAEQELAASEAALRDVVRLRHESRTRGTLLDSSCATRLAAQTPTAAAARLAETLTNLADVAGVKVNALQLRADTVATRDGLATVAVRVIGTVDVRGVAILLRDIESDEAMLAIRELDIAQPEPAAPPNRIESLRVEVLVRAIARVQSSQTIHRP